MYARVVLNLAVDGVFEVDGHGIIRGIILAHRCRLILTTLFVDDLPMCLFWCGSLSHSVRCCSHMLSSHVHAISNSCILRLIPVTHPHVVGIV